MEIFKNLFWGDWKGSSHRTWGHQVDTNDHNAIKTASVFQSCELLMFQNYKMNTSHLSVLLLFTSISRF